MKHAMNIFVYVLFALAAVACTTQSVKIDTAEKRIALFETSYQEVLKVVILYRSEGRISDSNWANIKQRVADISLARHALYEALKLGDLDTVNSQLVLVNRALTALRTYYAEQEVLK